MIRGSSISLFLNNREIKDPLASLPADVPWGSFVTHSFLSNECVTNEPQRTSAGRLSAGQSARKSCDLHMIG